MSPIPPWAFGEHRPDRVRKYESVSAVSQGQSRSGDLQQNGHPTVDPRDPRTINWAEVAARARADLGEERVARFSDRLRTAMTVAVLPVRPGADWPHRIREPTVPDE